MDTLKTCPTCGSELCDAIIFDRTHGINFVCSLPKKHEGAHFDKKHRARWEQETKT